MFNWRIIGKENVNFYDTNVSYREALKIRLGNLNNNFFTLFKKSVPFAPISDIEKFITEYVCDVKYEIDIYIPSLHTGIEYDGFAWHQNIKKDIDLSPFL